MTIASLPANITAFSDSPGHMSEGIEFTYRVIAANCAGDSIPSNEVTVASPLLPVPPQEELPLVIVQQISQHQIMLKHYNTSSTGYTLIERKQDPVSEFTEIAQLPPCKSFFMDKGLLPDTLYVYRVRTQNTAGYSDYSPPQSIRTGTTPPAPPAAPGYMAGRVLSPHRIELSWSDNSYNECGIYEE
jgi:hypothetical protein